MSKYIEGIGVVETSISKEDEVIRLFNIGYILTDIFKRNASSIFIDCNYTNVIVNGYHYSTAIYVPPDLTESGEENTITIELHTKSIIKDEQNIHQILTTELGTGQRLYRYYDEDIIITQSRQTPIKFQGLLNNDINRNAPQLYVYQFDLKYRIIRKEKFKHEIVCPQMINGYDG